MSKEEIAYKELINFMKGKGIGSFDSPYHEIDKGIEEAANEMIASKKELIDILFRCKCK